MQLLPPADPFWGSGPAEGARWHLFGAPLELTVSGRGGTRDGPPAVREASQLIESYSPTLDGDLFDARFADLGDLDLAGLDLETCLDAIERATASLLERGRPIMVGGEHTGTLGAARAVKRKYPDAVIVSLDAHLDIADELDGKRLAHGTWGARLADEAGYDCLALLGARSGTRDEWRRARSCAWCSQNLVLTDELRERLAGRPVYLSVDIDVVDPAAAPGTGCPEPGGPDSRELFRFLHSLKGLNVVGMDVMEVLPGVDPAGITAALAAKLIRETVILFDS